MIIGVDFDNTIVDYGYVFYQVALERNMIPEGLERSKKVVRDYLRSCGKEDDWIELQGVVYGPSMIRAEPYPGVKGFFRKCREVGMPVYIISHRTRHPFVGPKHDLHKFARSWLEEKGFHGPDAGIPKEKVFFELKKEDKIRRISQVGCTHFIDDLPEFLGHPAFDRSVRRILFDPHRKHVDDARFERLLSWNDMIRRLDGQDG